MGGGGARKTTVKGLTRAYWAQTSAALLPADQSNGRVGHRAAETGIPGAFVPRRGNCSRHSDSPVRAIEHHRPRLWVVGIKAPHISPWPENSKANLESSSLVHPKNTCATIHPLAPRTMPLTLSAQRPLSLLHVALSHNVAWVEFQLLHLTAVLCPVTEVCLGLWQRTRSPDRAAPNPRLRSHMGGVLSSSTFRLSLLDLKYALRALSSLGDWR